MPGTIEGVIESIDTEGNLVTNLTNQQLAEAQATEGVRVECDEHETLGIFSDLSDQPPMTFAARLGPSGRLELVIVGDSAALMLGVRPGTPVRVRW